MLSQDRDRPPIPAPPVPGLVPGPDVALVHWPDDDATRRRLQAARRPRLLLVAAGAPPPVAVDELEDWVRLPVDPEELDIRRATLARRAAATGPDDGYRPDLAAGPTPATLPVAVALPEPVPARPEVDDHGILRHGDRWVALSPVELRTVDHLLGSWGRVVRRPDLTRATWPDGPPADQRAIDGVVKRLRRRLTPLGLRIHTVTGKGFLLDVDVVDVEGATGAG